MDDRNEAIKQPEILIHNATLKRLFTWVQITMLLLCIFLWVTVYSK